MPMPSSWTESMTSPLSRSQPETSTVASGGEDQQVLAVAAHDGGEVVELEQGAEALGVLLALLQALDDAELALDEAEGAQGEVDEGAVDGVAGLVQAVGGLGELGAQRLAVG